MTLPEHFQGLPSASLEEIQPAEFSVQCVYRATSSAVAAVHSWACMPPQAIYMHPLTWDWFLSILDGADRPMFLPRGNCPPTEGVTCEEFQREVGQMHALPVITDPYVSRDEILVLRRDPDAVAVVSGLEIPA